MPTYTVTLNSGATYDIDADSAAQAARLANENAMESGDAVLNVTEEGETTPVEIGTGADRRAFQDTGFDPALTGGGPAGAAPSIFDELTREEALALFGEDVPATERQDFVPTLASEGEQTSQIQGMPGTEVGEEIAMQPVEKAVDVFDDTGLFEMPQDMLDQFGLGPGSYFDRESGLFLDAEGNVIRKPSGLERTFLKSLGVESLAGTDVSDLAMSGAMEPTGATTSRYGPYDTGALSDAARATGMFARPDTLEDIDPNAAYLRGLQMGGYGDISGPRTGFQRYLERLSPLYQNLFGLQSLATGYSPGAAQLDALGIDPSLIDQAAPVTFEEFVAGTGPRAARQQSLDLFNQLATGMGTPQDEGTFAQVFGDLLRDPNPELAGGLANLAQSALRSQVGATGFGLIAGGLPNPQELLSRQRAETGATMPTNFLETLGGAYGLKKRKVGADGSVTEEFFGG